MADGLCSVEIDCSVNEKTINYETVIDRENPDRMNDVSCENVKSYLISSDSDKLFNKLCESNNVNVVNKFLERPCSPSDEDCRKKRCVDRYDSSESSDRLVSFFLNFISIINKSLRRSMFFYLYCKYILVIYDYGITTTTTTPFNGTIFGLFCLNHGHCRGLHLR